MVTCWRRHCDCAETPGPPCSRDGTDSVTTDTHNQTCAHAYTQVANYMLRHRPTLCIRLACRLQKFYKNQKDVCECVLVRVCSFPGFVCVCFM